MAGIEQTKETYVVTIKFFVNASSDDEALDEVTPTLPREVPNVQWAWDNTHRW